MGKRKPYHKLAKKFVAEGEFMRVPRVAEQLDISRKRVYHMIAERKLDAIRVGRTLLIRTDSVCDFLKRAIEAFQEDAIYY